MKNIETFKPFLVAAVAVTAVFGGFAALTSPASARSLCEESCQTLWVMRNDIYKDKGYCFKTKRARKYFGNAGCWTSNAKLSRSEKNRVSRIKKCERRNEC